MNIEISVLIPVYGVEKYIEKCLRSIFTNSIADKCEFVIVNDCTPDSSMFIVQKVCDDFPYLKSNIHIINHDSNKGLAASRNTSLFHSTGKYIVCVDSDDWVEFDYLETLYNAIETECADIACCNYIIEYGKKSCYVNKEFQSSGRDCLPKILIGGKGRNVWSNMYKRSLFFDNNVFWTEGVDFGEDLLINSKIFPIAKKIAVVDKYLYHYSRQNSSSYCSSTEKNNLKIENLIKIENEIEQYLLNIDKSYEIFFCVFRKELKIDILMAATKNERMKYYKIWPDTDSMSIFYTDNKNKQLFSLFLKLHLYKLADFLLWLKNKMENRKISV